MIGPRSAGSPRGYGRCDLALALPVVGEELVVAVVDGDLWSRPQAGREMRRPPAGGRVAQVRKHKNCSAQSFLEVPPARIEKVPPRQPQQDQRGRRRGQGDAASPQPYRTRSRMRPGVLAADWQAIPKRSTRLLAGTEAEPRQGDPPPRGQARPRGRRDRRVR